MRKTLVALVAVLAVGGITTAAVAQTGSGGLTIVPSVSPTKAGTKKKPKNVKVKLVLKNSDTSLTATRITIFLAKTLRISTKGFKFCKQSTLENTAGAGCPAKSKAGGGTANAFAGVNTTAPSPLVFKVTAFLLSKSKIGFYLQQQGGFIKVTAVGKLGKASSPYGQKLTIDVPQIAKEFPTGVFNGLVGLTTTLGAKSGTHALIATTGCKKKKHPVKAVVNFQPNPNPPATPTLTAAGSAKCS